MTTADRVALAAGGLTLAQFKRAFARVLRGDEGPERQAALLIALCAWADTAETPEARAQALQTEYMHWRRGQGLLPNRRVRRQLARWEREAEEVCGEMACP